jgi:hypothetical protein
VSRLRGTITAAELAAELGRPESDVMAAVAELVEVDGEGAVIAEEATGDDATGTGWDIALWGHAAAAVTRSLSQYPPEWAVPTPDGWCARCGRAPGDEYYRHVDGECPRLPESVHPVDPAAHIELAVLRVLWDDLQVTGRGGRLDPVVAARALAMVAETLRLYTRRDGAS